MKEFEEGQGQKVERARRMRMRGRREGGIGETRSGRKKRRGQEANPFLFSRHCSMHRLLPSILTAFLGKYLLVPEFTLEQSVAMAGAIHSIAAARDQ